MPKKKKHQPKPCQRCSDEFAIRGEKYCEDCKTVVLRELKDAGYLSDEKPPSTFSDARGRKSRDTRMLGGSAEFGTDGDNW